MPKLSTPCIWRTSMCVFTYKHFPTCLSKTRTPLKSAQIRGWRDVSEVKSIGSSSRRLWSNSLSTHSDSQPSVSPIPRHPEPSPHLHRHCPQVVCKHTCRQKAQTPKIKIYFLSSKFICWGPILELHITPNTSHLHGETHHRFSFWGLYAVNCSNKFVN